ncbi:hypothetical protein CRYUN_Cryun41cG0058200 [Craigia yunnanensis]
MTERGMEPNVVTYNVMLNGICRRVSLHPAERFDRTIRNAEKVFDEMRQRGIEPDVTSFSIVLHVYSKAHKPELRLDKLKLEEAEKLLGEMVSNGVSPSAATYNCFFKEYRGRKDNTEGPVLDSYTLLISGLCEKQKWREACVLFVEMIEKGLLPQKVTFETLYKGLIQSNMLRTWRRLKKKLDEESITFGSEFQDYHLKPYRR